MSERVLVTGACGFVGSHLVEGLATTDYDVVATDLDQAQRTAYYADRSEEGNELPEPRYYGDFLEKFDVDFIPADLTDRDSLAAVFDREYDVVFHTASLYDYFAEWETLYEVNVEGARNIGLLAAASEVDHFIHWSTLGVCGSKEERDESGPVGEDAAYEPHNRYCESKVKQEKTLLGISDDHGLPLTILRPAPIYGPRNQYGVYHLLYLYRKVGTGLVFPVYPRSRQLHFPCIHVTDLVSAALFVHEHPSQTTDEVYHVTSDPIRQDELITFIGKALGLPIKRIPLPWPIYKSTAGWLVSIAEYLERRARKQDIRPKFPASMARYLQGDFWFTNEKLKNTGFEFKYADPRDGLWQYITWCKRRGML